VPPNTDATYKTPIQMLQEQRDQAIGNIQRLKAEGKQLRQREDQILNQKEMLGRKYASWETQLKLLNNMILQHMPPPPAQQQQNHNGVGVKVN